MICDDEDLQPHMPQMLFINERQISQTEFDSLEGSWLPNLTAYRVDNAWMSCEKMNMVLKSLRDAVALHTADRRVFSRPIATGRTSHLVRGNLLPL